MKIGITGIANGGKTVFLTSLIWQLKEYSSADFKLHDKFGSPKFKHLPNNGPIGDRFPFDKYQKKLSQGGEWPEKTTDCHRYTCEIFGKQWKRRGLDKLQLMIGGMFSNTEKLDFFDFAGERIADAAIAAFDDYGEWSDHLLDHYSGHSDYTEATSNYFSAMDELPSNQSDKEDAIDLLIREYKISLGKLIHNYKPLISPSTFLLDTKGNVPDPLSPEELADTRIVGLEKSEQFVPLSAAARETAPDLVAEMRKRFKRYRKDLVLPLFEEIFASQRLVVLVDIPSLLQGGVGRFNDNRQVLLDLFHAVDPDGPLGGLIAKIRSFFGSSLEKVAFVATKADMVAHEDVSSDKLKSLLEQMTEGTKSILPDVEFECFVCSAIQSSRRGEEADQLIGCPARNADSELEQEFKVSRLPETWPDNWSAGEFRFTELHPKVSKNYLKPPKQEGLNRIFEYLITERSSK